MSVRSALAVLADVRDDRTVVVTNQGSARVWPLIADHPLDLHYNPSTMGGAIPLALGLALAHPSLHVIVVSGDGALTMSLGSLITVVAASATNVTVVVLDNGIYEVTGGQQTAGSVAQIDYAGLARAAGFRCCHEFRNEASWTEQAATVMTEPGPRFLSLRVQPTLPDDLKTAPTPMPEQLERITREVRRRT